MTPDARQAPVTADDGFHEIHLSGKQLVFLFMSTTVVAIVIFLCGVLVGRGARLSGQAEPGRVAPAQAGTAGPVDAPATGTAVGAGELSYYERLGAEEPPAENVKSATEVPPSTGATAPKPGAARPAPTVPVAAAGKPAKAAGVPADASSGARRGGTSGPAPPAAAPAPAPRKPPAPASAPATAGAAVTPSRVAGGYTVQLLVDAGTGEPYYVSPELLVRCRERWRAGAFR